MCARLHAICIVVMRALGDDGVHLHRVWVSVRARVGGSAHVRGGFSSLFPVLMMRLIICSASFHPPQAHVHTRARTYALARTRAHTHACVTSPRQQTQQHLFGHKLRLVREGERRGERRGSRRVRVHSRFGVKRAVKLCFSGTSPPGGETSVSPSQGSGMGKNEQSSIRMMT